MEDFGENQALLTTELNIENSRRYRLANRDEDSRSEDDSCQSEEWWSDSSSCSSCDSDVCSVADWQSEVNPLGELMYIESIFSEIDVNDSNDCQISENQEATTSNAKIKKTTQNKLIRLIRRRNSGTRRSTRKKLLDVKDTTSAGNNGVQPTNCISASVNTTNVSSNRVSVSEWPETELQTVRIKVFGENLGRRATLCESLLGIAITTFPDKSNIMIANIVPNTEAAKHHNIKTGDWLCSINGHQVIIDNVNNILKTIIPPAEVTLGLQRITSDLSIDLPSPQTHHQSELVRSILSSNNTLKLLETNKTCLFSVMYLTHTDMTADDDEISPDQGIIYCYPPSPDLNTLYKIRGAFITLHCLMKDSVLSQHPPSEPVSSSVYYNENLIHIIYFSDDQNLLLLSVPHDKCSLADAEMLTTDIVRCLRFKYQSLIKCFKTKEHIPLLEQFFSMILSRIYSPSSNCPQFEFLFPAAHWIPLPRDAQMQIDDALSELEANDFGSYINNNHGCQRLYSVIGTCLYFKGYLLSSHLARQDLVDVNSWCSQRGLLNLTKIENLANLVTWHEVYPASCNRGLSCSNANLTCGLTTATTISDSSFPCPPNARWFLLIVGQGNSLLVVLLEAGGCSMEAIGKVGPDIYYVQQAQATLSHIYKIGVPALADKWLSNTVRPQIVSLEYDYSNKTSPKRASTDNNCNISQQSRESSKSCENIQQSKINLSHVGSTSKLMSSSSLTSVIKHRNSPDSSINLIMSQSQNILQRTACHDEISEDSTRSSIVSDEVAPILGRRAERERERAAATSDTNSHSRLSDSDFSDDSDWEPRRTLYGSRSLDMLMDLNKTKFSNSVPIIPSSLLAGKQNSLFHYVHLDKQEGVLISPPGSKESKTPLMSVILNQFRTSAQSIHALLQNTVEFKKLNAQEVHESLINKSLVAIKEYGLLFEIEMEQNKKSSATTLNFWVIGRLFFMPHAKEVYVCFEESAPQNMVEIAFRLALSSSG